MLRLTLVTLFVSVSLEAITFTEAVERLNKHESVSSVQLKQSAIKEQAVSKGSWGDPVVRLAAKNFPVETLSSSQSPMSGVELTLSQKVPLSSKYSEQEEALKALSQAYHFDAKNRKERLAKALWEAVVFQKKLLGELDILQDNALWVEKILKVSKRIYATGKLSQHALLEIEIRKSEIERDISNKRFEYQQFEEHLHYLIGDVTLEKKSIPWSLLESTSDKVIDYQALSLQTKLQMKQHTVQASKLNYIPDVTLSVGYTKRSDIDNHGDFISASVGFNLPFSDEKDALYEMERKEQLSLQKEYELYERTKKREIAVARQELAKVSQDLTIVTQKMIAFASNSRAITAKAYTTGSATYIELLQSELKLQKILIQKVNLEAQRALQQVALKYIKGEPLYE